MVVESNPGGGCGSPATDTAYSFGGPDASCGSVRSACGEGLGEAALNFPGILGFEAKDFFSKVPCRFGQACWRPYCRYRHEDPRQRAQLLAEFWASALTGKAEEQTSEDRAAAAKDGLLEQRVEAQLQEVDQRLQALRLELDYGKRASACIAVEFQELRQWTEKFAARMEAEQ